MTNYHNIWSPSFRCSLDPAILSFRIMWSVSPKLTFFVLFAQRLLLKHLLVSMSLFPFVEPSSQILYLLTFAQFLGCYWNFLIMLHQYFLCLLLFTSLSHVTTMTDLSAQTRNMEAGSCHGFNIIIIIYLMYV